MLQHHKGKVPYSIKNQTKPNQTKPKQNKTKQNKTKQNKTKNKTKQNQKKKQLTPCVLDAKLDYFEDFDLKKDFEPIKMNHS